MKIRPSDVLAVAGILLCTLALETSTPQRGFGSHAAKSVVCSRRERLARRQAQSGNAASSAEIRVARKAYVDSASTPLPHPLVAYSHPSPPIHNVVECDHREVSQGIWYRPRFLGLRKAERCSPDPFHPRGLGHLFARPSTPCRIDYAPTPLRTLETDYGPHYFRRAGSPYCEHHERCKCWRRSQKNCRHCR